MAGTGKLGEEALDEVEPGAVLGRERKVEAACRLCVEPGSVFFGETTPGLSKLGGGSK